MKLIHFTKKINQRLINRRSLLMSTFGLYLSTAPVAFASAANPAEEEVRDQVRHAYATIARAEQPCFSCSSTGACGSAGSSDAQQYARELGYTEADLQEAPIGADLGLGCGNPTAIASLKVGEVVVDLGSGGGFDCFLAAKKVGETGHVFGIDMTPEMLTLARKNAEKRGYTNVEFLEGTIEALPLPDAIADVILSNCVVNLSPNKERVFSEAARVLKVGGRIAISDVVTSSEIPEALRANKDLFTGCVVGATKIDTLKEILANVGFKEVRIDVKPDSRAFISKWAPDVGAEDFIAAANIYAIKK